MSIETQLQTLERLVPHLAQHGCDVSAQDGAREVMRYFDSAGSEEYGEERGAFGDLARERRVLGRTYARLRERLKDIAEGRSGVLSIDQVAAFTRFYREHLLREQGLMSPGALTQVNIRSARGATLRRG